MNNCLVITFLGVLNLLSVSFAQTVDISTFTPEEQAQAALLSKSGAASFEQVDAMAKMIEKSVKQKKTYFVGESSFDNDCSHCPKHVQLTGTINKVLEELKKNPNVVQEDEVPIAINRLKFLFYSVKNHEKDGSVTCQRYLDHTPDLKPTTFDGQMELMAENVFKFDAATSLQVLHPNKEEVIYYYRGEGEQKNIIVQAIMGKDGGKFRYYYYRPTAKELNPYNLPSLGSEEVYDPTAKKAKIGATTPPQNLFVDSPVPTVAQPKDKFNYNIDPKVEMRLKVIPQNVTIGNADISQGIGGENGVRVNANSNLSLKGNDAKISIQSEAGRQYVAIDMHTKLDGSTNHTITVPYDIKFGTVSSKDPVQLKGSVVDSNDLQVVTMTLTDSMTTYVRTEYKKDKLNNVNSFLIAKDIPMGKDEVSSVLMGTNETHNTYVAFQHRKAIKNTISMVLDVRVDENKKASLTYQLKAIF